MNAKLTTSVDRRDVVDTLLANKRFIAICVLVLTIAGGAWASIFPRQYRSSALVSIVAENRSISGGLGSIVGQLGALGSLAGAIGIGGAQRPEPLAVLQSRALTERFISENNLMPILYKSRWDEKNKTWKHSGIASKDPTLWKASEKFKSIRRVEQDSKTNLVTVTITWSDPQLAAQWANGLVKLTNEIMRQREIVDTQKNLDYLSTEVAKTDFVEIRSAISGLMESEIKRKMIANGTEEFALKTLDPAIAPEKPFTPGVLLSILLGALAGFLIGAFVSYYRSALARPPRFGERG